MPRIRNRDVPPFANWLAEARSAKGWSQTRLADETDITQEFVSALERGTRGPSKKMVQRLADALGIDPEAGLRAAFLPANEIRYPDHEPRGDIMREPPENFADWPQELQEALSYTQELTPEVQRYIYQLWREQARAHADIEGRRRKAEIALQEREERLKQQ